MSGPPPDAPEPDRLRQLLEVIPEVERAWVDGPPWQAFLFCTDGEAAAVEAAASVALARAGFGPETVAVRVAFASTGPRRRLRLVSSEVAHPTASRATSRVVLEWGGEEVPGEGVAEGGLAADLRAATAATLAAVAALAPAAPRIHLIGIKTVRVFDRDLVVTLLRAGDRADASLIGASLVDLGVAAAASKATLNALNRLLGNYLSVGE